MVKILSKTYTVKDLRDKRSGNNESDAHLFIPASCLLQLRRSRRGQGRDEESGRRRESHDGSVVYGDVKLDIEKRIHPLHARFPVIR